LGCNHVFLVGQMGKMLEEWDWKNHQKKAQERCMSFYYCPRIFVSKMVSSSRSRTIGEEEIEWATTKRQEEEKTFRERFIKNKWPINLTHIFPKKGEINKNKDN
jgi:hypothetical protein